MAPIAEPEPAHLMSDASGQIHTISRRARVLLRHRGVESGRSVLDCFAEYRKALISDMHLARAGWPTERTLPPTFAGPAVRYRVSRILPGGGLYWEFELAETEQRHCA